MDPESPCDWDVEPEQAIPDLEESARPSEAVVTKDSLKALAKADWSTPGQQHLDPISSPPDDTN